MLRGSLATQALHAPLSPPARVLRRGLRKSVPRRGAAPAGSRRAAHASQSPFVPALPPAPVSLTRQSANVSVALPALVTSAQLPALNSVPASALILAGLFAFGHLLSTWRSGWSATRSRLGSGERHRRASDARAPIAVFHDLENCAVPSAVQAWSVAGAVLEALRASGYGGVLRSYTAFGDMALLRPAIRRQLSSTGVRLCDVPSGRKDAADRALLLDMLLFARDTPPPAVVLLITGDRDFAPTAHRLTQLGYTVLLSAPLATATVAPELLSAAHRRFDWASMACGLVPFEERERERSSANGSDNEPDASPIGPLVGQAGNAAEEQHSSLSDLSAGGDYRFGRGRGARVGAFVSAAAAAIEREDVDELARVVASAQLSGLKTTREAALLADMRRRLKQRGAAAEEVSADLERAISTADPQLAASAVLAARTRGVSRMLAVQVAVAERIVRENRAARRGSRSRSGAADADDEDDEDDDDDDDDGDVPVTGAEAHEARTIHLERSEVTHRRASAALKEHRLTSRRRLVMSEIEAPDAWAGRPWTVSTGLTPVPPDDVAAETISPPPAADNPPALLSAYESDPTVPRWFVNALRVGLEGQDFAILSSVIARGAAANVDTTGAANILAVVSRARSVAGSLVRLSLTRKMQPLQSLVDSLTDLPVEALLTKEIADARDALARMLAAPTKPPDESAPADDSAVETGQYKARIREALEEEDPVALRAALLDAVLCTDVVHETALRRLKVLTVAHECIPELQRACAAQDLAVLRARILRVRRDFVAREPRRLFPATGGKLLAALISSVENAEAVLAELTASDAAAREDAAVDESDRDGGDGQAEVTAEVAEGSAAVAEPSAVVA